MLLKCTNVGDKRQNIVSRVCKWQNQDKDKVAFFEYFQRNDSSCSPAPELELQTIKMYHFFRQAEITLKQIQIHTIIVSLQRSLLSSVRDCPWSGASVNFSLMKSKPYQLFSWAAGSALLRTFSCMPQNRQVCGYKPKIIQNWQGPDFQQCHRRLSTQKSHNPRGIDSCCTYSWYCCGAIRNERSWGSVFFTMPH